MADSGIIADTGADRKTAVSHLFQTIGYHAVIQQLVISGVQYLLQTSSGALGQLQSSSQIVAGAGRNIAQSYGAAESQAVQHLVDRPVPAHGHDNPGLLTAFRQERRKVRGIPRFLRQMRFILHSRVD